MEFRVTDFNIIVLANANNPSILNPDFLKNNGIVTPELKPVEVICTPPFSHIKFEDKTSIVVDTERLTFADGESQRLPGESKIPSIANRYLEVLKHVPYTAVGINFNCIYDFSHMSPNQFVLNRFINKEIWKEFDEKSIIGLKLSFNIENPITHNIEINPATITDKKGGRPYQGIAIKSNFHCIPQDKPIDDIRKYIDNWMTYFGKLKNTLERFFY